MSYGERIFSLSNETPSGNTIRVSIMERDYTGAATEVEAAGVPAIVTVGRRGAELWGEIQGTEIEYRPIAKEPGDYDFILGGDETKFKILVSFVSGFTTLRSYEAFVYTDLYEENDNVYPQPVSIKGGDGLGRLDQPYNVVGERRSMIRILNDCLKKTGVEWDIAVADGLRASGQARAWDQTDIDDRIFVDRNGDPFTCKDVVQELIEAKGVNLTQRSQLWLVYGRLDTLPDYEGELYNDGVFFTTFDVQTPPVLLPAEKALRGVTMKKERIPRVIDHIYRHGALNGEIIQNGGFEEVVDGEPLNWEIITPVSPSANIFVEITGDDPLEGNNSLLMQSNDEFIQPQINSDSLIVLTAPDAALSVNRYELRFGFKPEAPDFSPGTFARPPTIRFLIGSQIWNGETNAWEADGTGKYTWRFGVPKEPGDDPLLRQYATGAWSSFSLESPTNPPTGNIRIEVLGVTPDEAVTPGDRLRAYFDAFQIDAVSSPFFQSLVNPVATRYRVEQGDTTLTFETEGIIGDGPLPLTQRSLSEDGAVTKDWGPDDEPLGIALNKRKMSQVIKGNSVIYGTFISPIQIWRPVLRDATSWMPTYVEITNMRKTYHTAELVELREDIEAVTTEVRPLFE